MTDDRWTEDRREKREAAAVMRRTLPVCVVCSGRNGDRYGPTGSPKCEECR